MSYFTISEFCITSDAIPQSIADKLLGYHITPMNKVRGELGEAIFVSKKSGWRPKQYELDNGRSGRSEHTFLPSDKDPLGRGAVDYTANRIDDLLELIIKHTDYTRICYYPNNKFVHCDYGFEERGRRLFKSQSPVGSWEFIKNV
jgi:hypothetical protein